MKKTKFAKKRPIYPTAPSPLMTTASHPCYTSPESSPRKGKRCLCASVPVQAGASQGDTADNGKITRGKGRGGTADLSG